MLLFVHACLSYPASSLCVLFMPVSLYVSQFSCLSCLQSNFPSGPPPPHLSGRTGRVFIRQLLFQLLTGRRGVKTWRLSRNLHRHPSKTASHPDTRGSHPDTPDSHPIVRPFSHPTLREREVIRHSGQSSDSRPFSHPTVWAINLTLRAVILTLRAVILPLGVVIRHSRQSSRHFTAVIPAYQPQLDGHPEPSVCC
jgi:hypothetical protein